MTSHKVIHLENPLNCWACGSRTSLLITWGEDWESPREELVYSMCLACVLKADMGIKPWKEAS